MYLKNISNSLSEKGIIIALAQNSEGTFKYMK